MYEISASITIVSACAFQAIVSKTHWKRHSTVVLYCRGTHKNKASSSVKHVGTTFSCMSISLLFTNCFQKKDKKSYLTKGRRWLEAKMKATNILNRKSTDVVNALCR